MSHVQEWADNLIHNYTGNKIEDMENKMHAWHWYGETEISLRGATAGPDRGQVFYKGRPLCNAGAGNNDGTWDINAANVICKMLGFPKAANAYKRVCQFGDCTASDWILGGFNCTGQEAKIIECPHETTPSSECNSAGLDMVGVECSTGESSLFILSQSLKLNQ